MSTTLSTNEPGTSQPLHLQVRAARLNAKLTIGELARLAGVNRTWLQKFENGGKNITLESLGRIMSQLPNAHFIVPGGGSISSAAADTADMSAHLRELARLTGEHATRIHAAVDALTALADSAAAIAHHTAAMQQLWRKSRAGADAGDPDRDRASGKGSGEAGDMLAGPPTRDGQPTPLESQPLPPPAAPVEEPLIRKRTLRFPFRFSSVFGPSSDDEK